MSSVIDDALALERQSVLSSILVKESSNDINAQKRRLIAALKALGYISTIEARRYLDVISPAPRILELREAGWRIDTHWAYEPTLEGREKRVARYVLQSGPQPDGDVYTPDESLPVALKEVTSND